MMGLDLWFIIFLLVSLPALVIFDDHMKRASAKPPNDRSTEGGSDEDLIQ